MQQFMSLIEQIEKYFSKDELLKIFVKYELYYQIGLGKMVYMTIQDLDETFKKINELNLKIESSVVINNIYFILLHFSEEENFDEKFDYHIRSRALAQALNDFIDSDKELNNPQLFADQIYQEIVNDRFFDSKMRTQFDEQYDLVYVSFEPVFTKEFAGKLKDSVISIYEYYDYKKDETTA